jgi:hypothetical protein
MISGQRVNKKSKLDSSRREFLEMSGRIILSASALSLSPFSLSASDITNLNLKHIDSSSAHMLAEISRLLFPHSKLEDEVYLDVIKDVENDIQIRPDTKKLITKAIERLNSEANGLWQEIPVSKQLHILSESQTSEWFAYLRNRTIESLYRNPEVWKLVGYQGSSIEHGGYLNRGFDDIDWLNADE